MILGIKLAVRRIFHMYLSKRKDRCMFEEV